MHITRETVNRVSKAIAQNNGNTLAAILKFNPNKPHKALITSLRRETNLDNICARLREPYDDLLVTHFHTQIAVSENNYKLAYEEISTTFGHFVKALTASNGNWLIPVLNVLTVLVREIAEKADDQSSEPKPVNTEDAERVIKQCFRVVFTCREPPESSKKFGALYIINNLFKIYFKLNNLRLCHNLIKYIPNLPDLSKFPLSQNITYNYFVGRLSMFEGKYTKARDHLNFAFTKCTVRKKKNKRLILMYLIPVQMLCGKLPTEHLLHKYNLPQFSGIVQSNRNGNMKEFNDSLLKHSEFFIQKGIYLVLEKLQYITCRNLFRKIYHLNGKQNKLPVTELVHIMKWLGVDVDVDEVECIIANLILKKYMKGYISHRLHTVVLSRKDPFPHI